MSGQPTTAKSLFIPPPIDGLNLVSPPSQIQQTEAIALLNYLTFDWGIRQRGKATLIKTFLAGIPTLYPYFDNGGTEFLFVCTENKLYRMSSPSDNAPGNVTGGLTITNNAWAINEFNKTVFFFNGVDSPIAYNIQAGTTSNPAFTGPSSNSSLIQATNYKNRLYVVENASSRVWYGGLSAITGALTSFDVGQVQAINAPICCVGTWSFNQGLSNEQIFVIATNAGEILCYTGDYPAATNWQLAARAQIPQLVGNRAMKSIGSELYIYTKRGVLPLSQIVQGRTEGTEGYYATSRKLGSMNNIENSINNASVAFSRTLPFLYWTGKNSASIYALNYERGSWSEIVVTGVSGIHQEIAHFQDSLMVTDGTGKIYRIPDTVSTGSDTTDTYTWQTPFMTLPPDGRSSDVQRNVKLVRLQARNLESTQNKVRTSVAIAADFAATAATADAKSQTSSGTNIYVLEAAPPGIGRRLSFQFSSTGIGEMNEYLGFEAFWTEGGVY